MQIHTETDAIIVEIDGEDYPLAERTVAVADALLNAARRCRGKPEYRLWLEELRILLGKAAVDRLFSDGRAENLDRMERIHAGVRDAFGANSAALAAERLKDRADSLRQITEALIPLNELLGRVSDMDEAAAKAVIRRPR